MPELLPTTWRLARKAVVFEIGMYRSLLRWVARRPHVPAGTTPIGYSRQVTPVMWLWIFGSAAELPLVHVLVPWDGVRIALLAIGVWGLVWMIGLMASYRVYPHLLGESSLRIRNGVSVDLDVPLAELTSIVSRRQDHPSSARALQWAESDQGTALAVAVSGQTNVQATLRRPMTVATPKGELQVTRLSLLADEPQQVVKQVRQRLAERSRGDAEPAQGPTQPSGR